MTAAEPLYYEHFAHRPLPWPEHLGRWTWRITDGMGGRTLIEGTALTERGAARKQAAAFARCQQRAPYTHEPRHPLTSAELAWINTVLDLAGIPVEVQTCGTAVVVTPQSKLTTEQEVRALTEVLDRTDAPVRWAGVA
ncbi:hypothetical protein Aph02nite_17100 [Actinoplanes philippinensis]|uniref:Uncharacterized protein n=1 Tax=Actinoplanes philippinensis TaxID=35752 RepID=A0A1I2BBI7_9ACTN|nr:hypothetical protein [Actinoplanes philippinensis]GIE75760.1 hypothetical protein Aph02nite_17100 [Actinoplanes philippinensis]SFE52510.1 hypothetical protein SAMN05421541_102174 [Actinoplanes philippinensis]